MCKKLFGYWEMPDLRTKSPLYRQDLTLRNAQEIVDDLNSAYYGDYGKGHMITDHANSWVGKGNWAMNKVKLDSKAYLTTVDGKREEYVCYLVCRADYGEMVYTINRKGILPYRETDIACICCATADASEAYIAMFRLNRVMT